MVKRPNDSNSYGPCGRQLFSDGNGQQGLHGYCQRYGNGAFSIDSISNFNTSVLQRRIEWNRNGYTCGW